EAVFGHEAGHVLHGHIPYYLAFLTLSLLVLAFTFSLAVDLTAGPVQQFLNDNAQWLMMPLVAVYVFSVFGLVSRRCGGEGGVFGCRTVSCPGQNCDGHDERTELAKRARGLCPTGIRTFVSALEKVADINGLSRRRPSFLQAWQHGSIESRVAFLERAAVTPG